MQTGRRARGVKVANGERLAKVGAMLQMGEVWATRGAVWGSASLKLGRVEVVG